MSVDPVVVVGCGASAVHFAQSALEKGRKVVMVDVGKKRRPALQPDQSLTTLRRELDDPVSYFLGKSYESLIPPGHDGEYYGFPPTKNYVFEQPCAEKSWNSRLKTTDNLSRG